MATKLRASCDGCHFAKIKCIKTEQGCQRCCASGEQCSYSPAQPRVYHKKRIRKSSSTVSILVDEYDGKHPTSANSASHVTSSSVTQSLSPKALNASESVETLNGDASVKSILQDFNLTSNGPSDLYWPYVSEGSLVGNLESAPDLRAIDLWGHAGTPPGLTNIMTPSSPVNTTSSGASTQHLKDFAPKRSRRGEGPGVPNPETPTILDFQTTANYQSCKCFVGLLTAMQRISEHANTSDPALDSVLCGNRAAAKHCIGSLHCAYGSASTDNVSCTSVACGLLEHILSSYQAALDSFCADLERDKVEDQGGVAEEDEDKIVPSGLQVRLGAFAVGKGEQVLCAKEIVAREIEKLRFAVEGCIKEGENIRSVLLAHLIQRCAKLVDEITS